MNIINYYLAKHIMFNGNKIDYKAVSNDNLISRGDDEIVISFTMTFNFNEPIDIPKEKPILYIVKEDTGGQNV